MELQIIISAAAGSCIAELVLKTALRAKRKRAWKNFLRELQDSVKKVSVEIKKQWDAISSEERADILKELDAAIEKFLLTNKEKDIKATAEKLNRQIRFYSPEIAQYIEKKAAEFAKCGLD